jgi:hypothetical protein
MRRTTVRGAFTPAISEIPTVTSGRSSGTRKCHRSHNRFRHSAAPPISGEPARLAAGTIQAIAQRPVEAFEVDRHELPTQDRIMNQSLTEVEAHVAAEPRVRYVTTHDGVRIAFWAFGHGMPLVYLTGGPWSHVELWDVPECRQWYERRTRNRMLVRYDVRGTGLSQRAVSDHSLDALLHDLTAVVDGLGLDRFALLGAADAGPVAVAYATVDPVAGYPRDPAPPAQDADR